MNTSIQRMCLAALLLCSMGTVQAGIQLSSTRVIMNDEQKHVSVFAKNVVAEPYVVQAWIDGAAEEMETPFFITPPLSRFDAGVERRLTITRVGEGMPQDRESYYWINVLEIPQKKNAADNTLSLAMHTRIKLFYRPASILKQPRGPELLQWKLGRDGDACRLMLHNQSAYTINFARIDIAGEDANFGRAVIALPLATTAVALSRCPATDATQVIAHVVNDYGVVEAWPAATVTSAAQAR